MKIKRRILASLLVLVLCLSLTVTAFADTEIVSAGIYISLTGKLDQSSSSFMATTTDVRVNPDRAYLKTTVEYRDGDTYLASNQKLSSRGDTSLPYDSPIYIDVIYEPTVAFCAHDVYGGTESDKGYAAYTMEKLNLG